MADNNTPTDDGTTLEVYDTGKTFLTRVWMIDPKSIIGYEVVGLRRSQNNKLSTEGTPVESREWYAKGEFAHIPKKVGIHNVTTRSGDKVNSSQFEVKMPEDGVFTIERLPFAEVCKRFPQPAAVAVQSAPAVAAAAN